MPISKCSDGKWRIGTGKCIYDTREKALKAYQAILASGNMKKDKEPKEEPKKKKK